MRLLFFGLSKSDCFVVHLGSFVCVATGASVHRRGRCIGVSLPLANDTSLVLVLVCLSVDVTGALALPNSFCVDYLHVLHAPLPIYPFCHLALLWSGVCCLLLPCRCCPPPFCLCCLCVFASGARWDLRFLAFSGSAGSPPFSVLCALLVSGAVFGVSVLPALPCCVSCLCSSCLPCPADSLLCALVQLTLLCAGASLGVSGCSCDGSVALLSCWVYGLALFSLRHSVHGNKGFLPCVGFFTLYTMLLVTSGSLVRPYRGIHRYDDPDTS